MSGNCRRRLTWFHMISVLVLALAALPLSLRAVRAAGEPASAETAPAAPESQPVNSQAATRPSPTVQWIDELDANPSTPDPAALPPLAVEEELERQLRKPVKLQFVEVPLEEVLSQLENTVGVNIHVDTVALDELGLPVDTPVTIQLKNQVSLRSALNLILKPINLAFVVQDEVIKVTTPELAVKPDHPPQIDAFPFSPAQDAGPASAPDASTLGPNELSALREHVRFLHAHFERVEARVKAGTGTADARNLAGYEMATAESALARAEGRVDEAAKHAERARQFAEQALKSVMAAYEAGEVTNEVVLQAAGHVSESRRRLINLRERRVPTAAQPQPTTKNNRQELREAVLPPSGESESPLSNGVWKKIIASKKQDYERMQALVEKQVVSSTELERAKTEYEIHLARYEQAMRAQKYNQLLVELAEIEYQEAVAKQKSDPSSVSDFELRKLQIKVQLAKAKMAELAD